MKKKFIKGIAILALASITLFSCSTDETQNADNAAVSKIATTSKGAGSSVASRNAGEVYTGFKLLMVQLYTNQQTVGTTVSYNRDGRNYLISEVSVNNNLKGYFLEIPSTKEVFYLTENPSAGTVDQYTAGLLGSLTKKVYDLTKDPIYATYGFSTNTPVFTGKFFGTVYTYGACGPNGEYGVFSSYYIFGVRVSGPDPVQVPNSSGTGYVNLSIPCGTIYNP